MTLVPRLSNGSRSGLHVRSSLLVRGGLLLRRSLLLIVPLLLVASPLVIAAPEASPLALAEQAAFQAAVDRVAPAIVRIEPTGISTARLGRTAEAAPATGPSTGLVVGSEGWILTTAFAVPADTTEAVVMLPAAPGADEAAASTRLVGRVAGRDTNRDLVLLKCAPSSPLTVPEWAPQDQVVPGQWAIAAGRVWDPAQPSLAVGVVSAVDRAWGRAIQTDAAVSPANYGGPLIDIRGRVLGIIAPLPADTAGMNLGTELYDSGIGFAVPMTDLLPLLPRLKQGEELAAGLLGIGYDATDPINGPPRIGSVRADSPAAAAGLRSGDTIVAIDGNPVSRIADVRHAITPRLAGDAVTLAIRRGPSETAKKLTVTATLVDRLPPWRRAMLGLVPVRRPIRGRDAAATPEPAAVGWVWPQSPAAIAGLEPGDTITAAAVVPDTAEPELRPIATTAELAGLLGGLAAGTGVQLTFDRDGSEGRAELTTVPLPAVPPELPPLAEVAGQPPPQVIKLEAPELADPGWAIVPAAEDGPPLGVLVWFDEPQGALTADSITGRVAACRDAVVRSQVAVVLIGSTDPARWSRADLDRVGRSLEVLRSRRQLDPSRIAVAGRGAGGTFAWLAADRFAPVIRGVALIDAVLPRRTEITEAAPERFRWVLFGGGVSAETAPNAATARRQAADRERLSKAGITVGDLPEVDSDAARAAALCRWVEALGVL